MDPREAEFLLKYFTDLNKIDIPIDVKDNPYTFGGKLSKLGSRIGTPVKNFINRKLKNFIQSKVKNYLKN